MVFLLLFLGLFLRKNLTWNTKDYYCHQSSAQWLHNGIICNIFHIVRILYMTPIPNVSNLPRLFVLSMVSRELSPGRELSIGWPSHPWRGTLRWHQTPAVLAQQELGRGQTPSREQCLLLWASLARAEPCQPQSCYTQRVICDLGEMSSATGEEEQTPHSLVLCSHLAINFPSPWEHEITPCETTQHPQHLALHSSLNREHFIQSLAQELGEAGYQFQLSSHTESLRKHRIWARTQGERHSILCMWCSSSANTVNTKENAITSSFLLFLAHQTVFAGSLHIRIYHCFFSK